MFLSVLSVLLSTFSASPSLFASLCLCFSSFSFSFSVSISFSSLYLKLFLPLFVFVSGSLFISHMPSPSLLPHLIPTSTQPALTLGLLKLLHQTLSLLLDSFLNTLLPHLSSDLQLWPEHLKPLCVPSLQIPPDSSIRLNTKSFRAFVPRVRLPLALRVQVEPPKPSGVFFKTSTLLSA